MLIIRDYVIPLVLRSKEAGNGVYYLSNYPKKAYDECAKSLAFMPYMDGGIVSFKAGVGKAGSANVPVLSGAAFIVPGGLHVR